MRCVLFVLLLFCYCSYGQTAQIKIGDKLNLAQYSITILNNKNIDENKPIILDFWATWCAPCIATFPHLDSIQAKYNQKIQTIALSDERKEIVEKFLTRKKYKHLIFVTDSQKAIFNLFDVEARPLTAFLSPEGELLWVGSSEKLEEVIQSFLKEGKIPANQGYQESTTKYYSKIVPNNSATELLNYRIAVSGKNAEYFAKTQKGKRIDEAIDIQYKATPVAEIVQELLDAPNLRFKNNRKDLDTILIDLAAKSTVPTLTYRVVSEKILTDLELSYGFKIKKEQKNTDIYQLKVIDNKKLSSFQNDIEGGGMVQKKGESTNVIRLNLEQIAGYFEKKLKTYILYSGKNNAKYDFSLQQFSSVEELNKQLHNLGLMLEKGSATLTFFELK